MFPTTLAVFALSTYASLCGCSDRGYYTAMEKAASWVLRCIRPDGGVGLREGVDSVPCSSFMAASTLQCVHFSIPRILSEYIRRSSRQHSIEDVVDSIGEPREATGIGWGRYKFLLISKAWCLRGTLACEEAARAPSVITSLRRLIREADDGLWSIMDGRTIWPSQFCATSLRAWVQLIDGFGTAGLLNAPLLGVGVGDAELPREHISVYIVHSSNDSELAESVARCFRAADVEIWLDRDDLIAGKPVSHQMIQGMSACNVALLLLTANTELSPWMNWELEHLVARVVNDSRLSIMPVRFLNSNPLPHLVGHLPYLDAATDAEVFVQVMSKLKARN
jgi:hypothetical protein